MVELESEILGAALLGKRAPLYVAAGALVTNLSAHFKWGRESSLVFVTTLDKGEPVPNASVAIRDISGKDTMAGKDRQKRYCLCEYTSARRAYNTSPLLSVNMILKTLTMTVLNFRPLPEWAPVYLFL